MGLFKSVLKGAGDLFGFEERPVMDQPLTVLKGAKAEVVQQPVKPVMEKKQIQVDLQKTNILLTEPRNVEDDYWEILRLLRGKQVVLINTKYLDTPSSKKLLDTASGVVYALNGHMAKVNSSVFLCAPGSVNVISDEQDDVLFNEDVPEPQVAVQPAYAATGTYDSAPSYTPVAAAPASPAPAQPYFY